MVGIMPRSRSESMWPLDQQHLGAHDFWGVFDSGAFEFPFGVIALIALWAPLGAKAQSRPYRRTLAAPLESMPL